MLVGREAELSAVEGFLDSIGHGFDVLVLEGDPGIGKTTVWQEAVSRAAERGYRTLTCRPAQAEAKLTFAALSDLLEPVPTFDGLPDPQRHALEVALLRAPGQGSRPEPRAAAAGLRSVLVALAGVSPVLLAIDDAQWLDSASAGALAFALRRLEGQRVGVLAARRPETGPSQPRLELPPGQLVELDQLSLAAIHEVLKGRLGRSLPRLALVRLYETCRGNPFFALEIAREIVQSGMGPADPLPVPPDLRRLVRRRLGRLSPAASEALLTAAALGEPTRALLAAALGADPSEALAEAEDAEFVELDGDRIRFAHPLYSAAIYAAAPRDRRRRLHRRLGEVVMDVEERARHLALATEAPSEEVAAVLEQAARQARTRGAAAAAASLFADASRLTPSGAEQPRARRALEAAQAYFDCADTGAARSILEGLLGDLPAGPERARTLLLTGLVHSYEDGPAKAREACLQAVEEAGDDTLLRAEALLRLSFVCVDDLALARSSARSARELVEHDPNAPNDVVAAALLDDAYMQFICGGGLKVDQVASAERLMPPHGQTWPAQRAHAVLQVWSKYTDNLARARELMEAVVARRRAEGDVYEAALVECHLAEVECWLGHWSRAREYADAGTRAIEQAGNPLWRAVTLYDRALIAAHLGTETEAREAALAGLELAERGGDLWIATLNLSVLGFLDLSVGDLQGADGWLSRAAAAVARIGMVEPARFRFHGDHIEAVIGLGELDRARDLIVQLQRRAELAPRPWIRVMSARSEGLLQAASGELGLALDALEATIREHERLDMPFERARTLLCLGRVQRRRKQRKAAREALQQSLGIFEELGAPLWAAKARAELERTHLREAPGELTPSEEQVARLAASGLKNREIAERLFVSPKTVEANLARVYRKLGIRSRAELGAAMGGAEPARSS